MQYVRAHALHFTHHQLDYNPVHVYTSCTCNIALHLLTMATRDYYILCNTALHMLTINH